MSLGVTAANRRRTVAPPTYPLNPGNLFTAPDDIGNAAWSKASALVTADATTDPNGTTNADLVIGSAVFSNHSFRQRATSTGALWFDLWAKANGYKRLSLREDYVSGNELVVDVDTGTQVSASGVNSVSLSIVSGWCHILFKTNATGANLGLGLYMLADTGANFASGWTPDGVHGIYFYHVQAYQ